MDVIDRLLAAASRKGWSQARLEKKAGLAQGRISKWKNGDGEPYWRHVVACARALDLPVAAFADDGSAPPAPTDDEAAVLDQYRVLGLGRDDALRALAAAYAAKAPATVRPTTPRGPATGANRDAAE